MDRVKYINNDPNIGWKLHLSFDINNTDMVSLFLSYLQKWYGIHFKIGRSSGQTGKDATIYCGSKKNAQYIADLIKEEIGHHLQHPHGDAMIDDVLFNDKVAGRFTTVRGGKFHQYGGQGIPYIGSDMMESVWHDKDWDKNLWRKSSFDRADKLLREEYGTYYTGRKKTILKRKVKRCICKKK